MCVCELLIAIIAIALVLFILKGIYDMLSIALNLIMLLIIPFYLKLLISLFISRCLQEWFHTVAHHLEAAALSYFHFLE